MTIATDHDETYDYIVVGSGAGGGPLSANLARAGYRVLLLEAGSDYESLNYTVPAFHGLATEDPNMRWDFFVNHYSDPIRQRRDSKYNVVHGGVLYPRASTLGGCTAHNAMITIAPPDSDWDAIATATGDASWGADRMRRYFERLERCDYVPRPTTRAESEDLRSGHGFEGWLGTALPDVRPVLGDGMLLKIALATAGVSFRHGLETSPELVRRAIAAVRGALTGRKDLLAALVRHVDPNDRMISRSSPEGLVLIPLSTRNARRNGPREYIRETQRLLPDRLVVQTNCLATRVILDEHNTAVGVEYLAGTHLYRADPLAQPSEAPEPQRRTAYARRETVLAAGSFNTPQLLMLSGIGPAEDLRRVGIDVRVDLPGVGHNLQDRYEIGVVTKTRSKFRLLQGLTFRPPKRGETPDAAFSQWQRGCGVYTANGIAFGVVKRSSPELADPDLFIFGLPARFSGYFPGYSTLLLREPNYFTWTILKAYTRNRAGTVSLRSADPTQVPKINFRYFSEGTDGEGADLRAVVDGVKFVRAIADVASAACGSEILPGRHADTAAKVSTFIEDEAWGHHASCTCKMGRPDDPTAVVDSSFRVLGTRSLRVVDASVFPRIPAFFIVAAVYMVSEKASDMIIQAARESGVGRRGPTPPSAGRRYAPNSSSAP